MIVFALYALKARGDAGASGGHVSNMQLIVDASRAGQCMVIAPNLSKNVITLLEGHGIRYLTAPFPEKGFSSRVRKRAWIKAQLDDVLSSSGVRVVLSTNGVSDIVYSLLMKRSVGAAHVIITRAFEDLYYSQHHGGAIARLKALAFDVAGMGRVRRAYRSADRVITNSRFMQRLVGNYFGIPRDRISVLYPPLSGKCHSYMQPRAELHVGMINPSAHKGEDVLTGLAASLPKIKFFYFSAAERNFRLPNLIYGGWKSHVEDIFSSIDVLLVPSRWHEPLGRAAIEALSHGRPVLVSNRGGLPETVDPYFVVLDDSVESWGAALKKISGDPERCRDAWGRSALALDRFSERVHAKAVTDIIKEVTS